MSQPGQYFAWNERDCSLAFSERADSHPALGIAEAVTIPDWEYDDLFTVTSDATGRATLTRSRSGVASMAR